VVHYWVDTWTFKKNSKKFKKNKIKNAKKPRRDTWHALGLTSVHLKKIKKNSKKIKKNSKKP